MHEMTLAVSIVDLAVQTAERENGNRISRIEIEVGNLAGVLTDSLEFCFEAASRATMAEGASFQIVLRKAHGLCKDCGSSFDVAAYYQHCPDCGGVGVEISGGQQLKVIAVTIEEEDTSV